MTRSTNGSGPYSRSISLCSRFWGRRFDSVSRPLPGYLEFFGYTTLFMLTVNVHLLIWAYRLGFSSRRPDLEHLETLSSNVDATILRLWVAREIRLALEVNENRLQNKATWITRAMRSSLFTVIMVAAMTALFLRFSV